MIFVNFKMAQLITYKTYSEDISLVESYIYRFNEISGDRYLLTRIQQMLRGSVPQTLI